MGVLDRHRARIACRWRGDDLIEIAPHDFERAQAPAHRAINVAQKSSHLGEIIERGERGLRAQRHFAQTDHDPGHNAESPFTANEQLLEIVAGIVLDHLVHRADDRAIGEDRFEPENIVARHAETNHPIATRIGRHIAADLARTTRAEIDREDQAMLLGFLLQQLQWHARLDRHRAPDRINLLDLGESLK